MSGYKSIAMFSVLTIVSLLYFLKYIAQNNLYFINQNNFVIQDERWGKSTEREYKYSSEQLKRLKHLKSYCAVKGNQHQIRSLLKFVRERFQVKESKGHIFVSPKKNLLYCAVPKVASTNWKRMMLLFDGAKSNMSEMSKKFKVHLQPGLTPLYRVHPKEMKKILIHYYKFLFVRHPFERIVSAYRNKFADNNEYFERTFGSRILRMSRKNLTKKAYSEGKGATFEEFALWVAEKQPYDPHWIPVHNLCHPCIVPYNFIGKMESLLPDTKEVLRIIKTDRKFPSNWTDGYKTSSKELMYRYFSRISNDTISKLYHYYREDFEAFGYNIPKGINSEHTESNNKFLTAMNRVLSRN